MTGVPSKPGRKTKLFWTLIGAGILDLKDFETPKFLPEQYRHALDNLPGLPDRKACFFIGSNMTERERRHIYGSVWKKLRVMGFKKPFRIFPWPGVPVLLQAVRDDVVVSSQGFTCRVPVIERSLALVGKNAVLYGMGIKLIVVGGYFPPEAAEVFQKGQVSCCTVDRIEEAVNWLSY